MTSTLTALILLCVFFSSEDKSWGHEKCWWAKWEWNTRWRPTLIAPPPHVVSRLSQSVPVFFFILTPGYWRMGFLSPNPSLFRKCWRTDHRSAGTPCSGLWQPYLHLSPQLCCCRAFACLFHACILYGCRAMTVTKSVHRNMNNQTSDSHDGEESNTSSFAVVSGDDPTSMPPLVAQEALLLVTLLTTMIAKPFETSYSNTGDRRRLWRNVRLTWPILSSLTPKLTLFFMTEFFVICKWAPTRLQFKYQ